MTTATAPCFRSLIYNTLIRPQFSGQKSNNHVYVSGPTGGEHLLAYVAVTQSREDGHTEKEWVTSATRSGVEDAFNILAEDGGIEVLELRLPTSAELTDFQEEQDRAWRCENDPTYFDDSEF